jgi:hypothetical protein
MRSRARWCVELELPWLLVIRDIGPWDQHSSVTNDAENVVYDLIHNDGLLKPGMRLWYYDSEGQLDELVVVGGLFCGFGPVTLDDKMLAGLLK